LAVASKIYGKTTNRRYNSHLIINDEGQIVSKYRKMHLFDVDLTSKGGLQLKESTSIERGKGIVDPIYSPCGYLGLSISFDLRFPEMYR
jgi:deaminated glutathione amidase